MTVKRVLPFALALIAVSAGSFVLGRWSRRPRRAAIRAELRSMAPAPAPVAAATDLIPGYVPAAVRSANPYAVVQGGICVPSNIPDQEQTSRKKWEALLRDPFWQSVFDGTNPESFSMVTTRVAMRRYVTYSKMKNGQLIHWTGKKILIPARTRVFANTRGDMYLCACGNRVAELLPPGAASSLLPLEEEPPTQYLVPPEPEPIPFDQTDWIPLVGPKQTPPIPEPSTLSLILVGLGSVAALAGRKRGR